MLILLPVFFCQNYRKSKMKSKIKISAVALLLLLIFHSCKTLQVEKPVESYLPSELAPAMSEIPLKIEIDIKKLETSINKRMSGLLFEGKQLNNQDLDVKVWKAGDFAFNVTDNVIEYRVPLKVWSKFGWNVSSFGFTVGDNYEANGTIALSYKTTINIDKNWAMKSKTVSTGYQWIETPRINIAGVNVPVSPIANYALSRFDKLITDEIDIALGGAADIKKYISLVWNMTQTPFQISEDYNTWVRITPSDIYLTPFKSIGQKLNLGVSLYTRIESFVGTQPQKLKTAPLPEFKYIQRPPQQFNINLAADATFEKISELAKKQLLNRTFTEGKNKITITDLAVFGSEGKAVFMAEVTGSVKGKIYFNGNLTYDPEKKAITVQNPAFDLKTKNALVKSANWLLHGVILNKITPYLTYPVSEDLEKMKVEANKILKNYDIYTGVKLNGNISELNVINLNLVPGAVRLVANARGNINIKIDDISF